MRTLKALVHRFGVPYLLGLCVAEVQPPLVKRNLSSIELQTEDGSFDGTLDELFSWAKGATKETNEVEGTDLPTFSPSFAPTHKILVQGTGSASQPFVPGFAELNPATPVFSPVNDRMVPTDAPYAPPLSLPPTTEKPVFHGKCNICGGGLVGYNDEIVNIPGNEPRPCGELFVMGLVGYIDSETCSILPDLIGETCGCSSNKLTQVPSSTPTASDVPDENRDSPTDMDTAAVDILVPTTTAGFSSAPISITASPALSPTVSTSAPTVKSGTSLNETVNVSTSPVLPPTHSNLISANSSAMNITASPVSPPSLSYTPIDYSSINSTSSNFTVSPVLPPNHSSDPIAPSFVDSLTSKISASPVLPPNHPTAPTAPLSSNSSVYNTTASPVLPPTHSDTPTDPTFGNPSVNTNDTESLVLPPADSNASIAPSVSILAVSNATTSPILPPALPPVYSDVAIAPSLSNSLASNMTVGPVLQPAYSYAPIDLLPSSSPTLQLVDPPSAPGDVTMSPVGFPFSASPVFGAEDGPSHIAETSGSPTLMHSASAVPSASPGETSRDSVAPTFWWTDQTLISCQGIFSGLEVITFEYVIEVLDGYDTTELMENLESDMNLHLADALLPCYNASNRRLQEGEVEILGVDSLPSDEPSERAFCGPSLDSSNECLVIEGVMQAMLGNIFDSDFVQYRVLSSLRDYLDGSPDLEGLVLSRYLSPEIDEPAQLNGADTTLENSEEASNRNTTIQAIVLFAVAATAITASIGIILLFRNRHQRKVNEAESSQGSRHEDHDIDLNPVEYNNFDSDQEVMSPFSSMLPNAYRLDSPSINTRSLVGYEMGMICEGDESQSDPIHRVPSEGSITDESEIDVSSVLNMSYLSQAPVLGAVRRKEDDLMVDLC